MSFLLVTSQISLTLNSLEASDMFFKRDQSVLNLLLKYMKGSCLAMIQTHTHVVFSTRTPIVLKSHVTVFDETNDSQVKQYDLDVIDDEEAPCDALQRMVIGDVRPQDLTEHQASQALNDTTPHTQDQEQDKENEHEDEQEEPQNKDQAHDQEENIDQGRDEDDRDHEGSRTRPPHP
jgi:hypothetical protein